MNDVKKITRYTLGERVRHRAVGKDGVLVELGSGNIVVVNEVGQRIAQLLESPVSTEEIIAHIASEFDVSLEQAGDDTRSYLAQLESESLLRTVEHSQ